MNRAENSAAINGVAGNSGHAELRERASGTIDAADASNQGAVLGHRAASEAYLADQDRPGTVELDHIRTTEPVANYFREGANQTGESFKSFGDGISDLKSRFTGEDHGDLGPKAGCKRTSRTTKILEVSWYHGNLGPKDPSRGSLTFFNIF